MLDLTKGRPGAVAVPLGGDALAMIRPATSIEVDRAAAVVRAQLAGLIAAEDAAALVAAALGEDFCGADFTDPKWQAAAAQQLALVELAALCIETWTGVAVDGVAVAPSRETVALLLRDPVTSQRVKVAIETRVHREIAEGEGLPASPSGAAEAGETIAPLAGARARPVH